MGPGGSFDGFEEGPIDFPPTFKYDVVRPNKFPKRSKSRRSPQQLPMENAPDTNPVVDAQEEEEDFEHEHEVDTVSLISSMMTSAQSRITVDDCVEHEEDDLGNSSTQKTALPSGNIADKVWAAAAAHKAKTKWITFLTASIPKSPHKQSKRKSRTESLRSRSNITDITQFTNAEPSPTLTESIHRTRSAHGSGVLLAGGDNHINSPYLDQDVDSLDPEERGVYDSSPKQRVPSWSVRVVLK